MIQPNPCSMTHVINYNDWHILIDHHIDSSCHVVNTSNLLLSLTLVGALLPLSLPSPIPVKRGRDVIAYPHSGGLSYLWSIEQLYSNSPFANCSPCRAGVKAYVKLIRPCLAQIWMRHTRNGSLFAVLSDFDRRSLCSKDSSSMTNGFVWWI